LRPEGCAGLVSDTICRPPAVHRSATHTVVQQTSATIFERA
jgi:hypothetical protein